MAGVRVRDFRKGVQFLQIASVLVLACLIEPTVAVSPSSSAPKAKGRIKQENRKNLAKKKVPVNVALKKNTSTVTVAKASAPRSATPIPPAKTVEISYGTEELRNRANARVFQLLTRSDGASVKKSYGSAFVVDENGILATNFHVVSDVIHAEEKVQLELVLNEKEILPARVLNFDVVNDLALVKVNHRFLAKYNLSAAPLYPGQKIFSLGLPNDTVMTMVEGLFNDQRWDGPVKRFYSSLPINSGMSGGPVLDEFDNVIAVNDAYLTAAQNLSILIPVEELKKLVSARAPASVSSAQESIKKQIEARLLPWLQEWKKNSNLMKTSSFSPYRIRELPKNLQCWEDSSSTAAQFFCGGMMGVTVGREARGADISFHYERPQKFFGNFVGQFYATEKKFKEEAREDGRDEEKYVCHDRIVRNEAGLKFLAHYCATNQKLNPELMNLSMSIRALETEFKPFVGHMTAIGLPRSLLVEASEAFLNGVSVDSGEGAAK